MMEVDKVTRDLDKPTSMEVDEEIQDKNKETTPISASELNIEIKKEPEEEDQTMEFEIKKEPEDPDENLQLEDKKESEEQRENKQPEVSKKPEEQGKNMELEVRKESDDQEINREPEVRKESDENMEPEVRKEPEEQNETNQIEDKKEPEEQDKDKQPEIKKEPEEQDKNEQPKDNDPGDSPSVKKDEDSSESSGSAEPDLRELIKLQAGASLKDDDEEILHLTADEVKQYLLKKIGEYMNSPVNPLFGLRAKAKEVEEKGKNQVEEYCKLYKGLQLLQRKHENFLRNVNILPKITMCHVNVSADLPMESVPNPEALMKKDLSITKVDPPANVVAGSKLVLPKATPAPVTKPSNIECIDLTDETDPPPPLVTPSKSLGYSVLKHPAPLPPRPFTTNVKRVPPKPRLKISAEDRGIVLQWDMPLNPKNNPTYDPIATFEIFGYQEQKNSVINTSLWKKIGGVKAMSLPMACTLTQFVDGNKYHFAIRAVDVNGLCGNYSDAISIVYNQKTQK